MSLEQDLAEARKKVQSWQSQTYVGIEFKQMKKEILGK